MRFIKKFVMSIIIEINNLRLRFFGVCFILRYCSYRLKTLYDIFLGRQMLIVYEKYWIFSLKKNIRTPFIIFQIFVKKVYNPPGFQIENNDIVIDVGANVGIYSVYAGSKTNNLILACEPEKTNLAFLKKNLSVNQTHNAKIIPFAISAQNGRVNFNISQESEQHSLYNSDYHVAWRRKVRISSLSLASLIKKYYLKKVDFLKMDCEGAEGEIIQSTSKNTLKKINKIVLEFHDDSSIIRHEKIAQILKKTGFAVKTRWNGISSYGLIYAKKINCSK